MSSSDLHEAVRAQKPQRVKRLLESGVVWDCPDTNGWFPLHKAAENGNLEILNYLLEKDTESRYVNHRSFDGYTPTLLAIRKGHVQCVAALLEFGADVNICDYMAKSPLHTALEFLPNDKILEVLDTLLGHSPKLDVICSDGLTPLHLAVAHDMGYELFPRLVGHGASYGIETRKGSIMVYAFSSAALNKDFSFLPMLFEGMINDADHLAVAQEVVAKKGFIRFMLNCFDILFGEESQVEALTILLSKRFRVLLDKVDFPRWNARRCALGFQYPKRLILNLMDIFEEDDVEFWMTLPFKSEFCTHTVSLAGAIACDPKSHIALIEVMKRGWPIYDDWVDYRDRSSVGDLIHAHFGAFAVERVLQIMVHACASRQLALPSGDVLCDVMSAIRLQFSFSMSWLIENKIKFLRCFADTAGPGSNPTYRLKIQDFRLACIVYGWRPQIVYQEAAGADVSSEDNDETLVEPVDELEMVQRGKRWDHYPEHPQDVHVMQCAPKRLAHICRLTIQEKLHPLVLASKSNGRFPVEDWILQKDMLPLPRATFEKLPSPLKKYLLFKDRPLETDEDISNYLTTVCYHTV